jgi:hypothetical protein
MRGVGGATGGLGSDMDEDMKWLRRLNILNIQK